MTLYSESGADTSFLSGQLSEMGYNGGNNTPLENLVISQDPRLQHARARSEQLGNLVAQRHGDGSDGIVRLTNSGHLVLNVPTGTEQLLARTVGSVHPSSQGGSRITNRICRYIPRNS